MAFPFFLMWGLATTAQPPAPTIHSAEVQTRLGYLIGDWTIEGQSIRVFRQKCSWYGSRSFVLCTFEDRRDGSTGHTVFGYSKIQRRYVNHRFDSNGVSQYQLGFPSGTYGIVFTDERPDTDGVARFQTSLNLQDEGLRYTQYKSVEGRAWMRTADIQYVPVGRTQTSKKRSRKTRRR
jgi:hypothetical protein